MRLFGVPVTEALGRDIKRRPAAELVRLAFRGCEAKVTYADARAVVGADEVLGLDVSVCDAKTVQESDTVDELQEYGSNEFIISDVLGKSANIRGNEAMIRTRCLSQIIPKRSPSGAYSITIKIQSPSSSMRLIPMMDGWPVAKR